MSYVGGTIFGQLIICLVLNRCRNNSDVVECILAEHLECWYERDNMKSGQVLAKTSWRQPNLTFDRIMKSNRFSVQKKKSIKKNKSKNKVSLETLSDEIVHILCLNPKVIFVDEVSFAWNIEIQIEIVQLIIWEHFGTMNSHKMKICESPTWVVLWSLLSTSSRANYKVKSCGIASSMREWDQVAPIISLLHMGLFHRQHM